MNEKTLENKDPDLPSTFWGWFFYLMGMALGILGVLVLLLSFITAAAVVNGIVIKVMWGWFLVPLGYPVVSLANAIGLGFLIRYLTWSHVRKHAQPPSKDSDRIKRAFMLAFVYPFVVLGFAGIVHLFM